MSICLRSIFLINIIFLPGGIIRDEIVSHQIHFGLSSVLTVNDDGSYIGSDIATSRYIRLPSKANIIGNSQ